MTDKDKPEALAEDNDRREAPEPEQRGETGMEVKSAIPVLAAFEIWNYSIPWNGKDHTEKAWLLDTTRIIERRFAAAIRDAEKRGFERGRNCDG